VQRSGPLHRFVAIRCFSADLPSVLSFQQPRRNGFDATREIVRNSLEIPVVITTLVSFKGWYGVRTEAINLRGKLQLSSKLSQTTTGMKSALLRVLNPHVKPA
jgi:hypothetical protein